MGFYYQKQQIIWSSQLHLRVKFRVSRIVRYFWLFCLALGLSWFRYPNIFGISFQSLRAKLHHTLFPVSMTTAWYKNSMHHCCCPPLTCMGLALPALPEINRNLIMFFFLVCTKKPQCGWESLDECQGICPCRYKKYFVCITFVLAASYLALLLLYVLWCH